MIKFCVIASGSKGNCTYVDVDGEGILLDAGLSYRRIATELTRINRSIEDLSGVFITHDHIDHIAAAPLLAKHCPVYQQSMGTIKPGMTLEWTYGFQVTAFQLSHDAPCVGFIVEDTAKNKLAYITDTGCMPEEAMPYLWESNAIIIEANYDEECLFNGPYPHELKERILSDHGHMGNKLAAEILRHLDWPGLDFVVGFHLSEANNNRTLAKYELQAAVSPLVPIILARQDMAGKLLTII